jgi:transposase-like protein
VVLELRCRRAFNTVIEVLRDGLTVVEVAELYGVSRQAVHGWLRRYSARGEWVTPGSSASSWSTVAVNSGGVMMRWRSVTGQSVPDRAHASEARRPGIWFRWVAPAAQCPMSRIAASTTQNQSQPVSPRPGVYSST